MCAFHACFPLCHLPHRRAPYLTMFMWRCDAFTALQSKLSISLSLPLLEQIL